MLDALLGQWAALSIAEVAGLVLGILAVVFLIVENIWTWPAGVAYSLISILLFWQHGLYGQLALNAFFLVMNLYGWYVWLRPRALRDALPVTRMPGRGWVIVAAGVLVGTAVLGRAMQLLTDAAVPYWDMLITLLSLAAMWLSAHKRHENWWLWLLVNMLSAPMFASQGLWLYALLYLLYVPMAIAGLRAWQRSLQPVPAG